MFGQVSDTRIVDLVRFTLHRVSHKRPNAIDILQRISSAAASPSVAAPPSVAVVGETLNEPQKFGKLADLSVEELSTTLRSCHLDACADIFTKQHIDGAICSHIVEDSELQELGWSHYIWQSTRHRCHDLPYHRVLRRCCAGHSPKAAARADSTMAQNPSLFGMRAPRVDYSCTCTSTCTKLLLSWGSSAGGNALIFGVGRGA